MSSLALAGMRSVDPHDQPLAPRWVKEGSLSDRLRRIARVVADSEPCSCFLASGHMWVRDLHLLHGGVLALRAPANMC